MKLKVYKVFGSDDNIRINALAVAETPEDAIALVWIQHKEFNHSLIGLKAVEFKSLTSTLTYKRIIDYEVLSTD